MLPAQKLVYKGDENAKLRHQLMNPSLRCGTCRRYSFPQVNRIRLLQKVRDILYTDFENALDTLVQLWEFQLRKFKKRLSK